jgi:hypothetical protein
LKQEEEDRIELINTLKAREEEMAELETEIETGRRRQNRN